MGAETGLHQQEVGEDEGAEFGHVRTRATTTVDADSLRIFLSLIHHFGWFGSISGRTSLLALSSDSLSLFRGLFEIWLKEYATPVVVDTTPMLSDESVLEADLDENMLFDWCSPIYSPNSNPTHIQRSFSSVSTCPCQPCPSRQSPTPVIPMAIVIHTHHNYWSSFSSLLLFCNRRLISLMMS